jgi:hypothetical protein
MDRSGVAVASRPTAGPGFGIGFSAEFAGGLAAVPDPCLGFAAAGFGDGDRTAVSPPPDDEDASGCANIAGSRHPHNRTITIQRPPDKPPWIPMLALIVPKKGITPNSASTPLPRPLTHVPANIQVPQ